MAEILNKVVTVLIGILVALGTWTLSRTFELSTSQAINQEKLVKLESTVEKLLAKDKEMQDQHSKLFEMLQANPSHKMDNSGYNYGNRPGR
jgi:cytochrome oxidase assembly protein ShyY1